MLSRARFLRLSVQFSVQSEFTAFAGKTYRHSKEIYRHIQYDDDDDDVRISLTLKWYYDENRIFPI